ncbi:MAG: hypothetical protein HKL82_04120 [Acidimicrobiaceae bacterium]|nr:hypothetical protein [Acidimicrobiaceae bacterium]
MASLTALAGIFAALINLDGPGHYLHWGFIEISYGNLAVIIVLIVLFFAAVLVPFPHHKGSDQK